MITRSALFVATVAVVLGTFSFASAGVIQTGNSATTQGTLACSANDLVNDGQATLLSEERSHRDFFNDGTTIPWANDGAVKTTTDSSEGEYFPYNAFSSSQLPVTYTFMLDVTSNTGGYDITGIDSFAGWNENPRALSHQVFSLEISKVGDDSWLDMGIYTYTPFTLTEAGESQTMVSLTNDGGGALDNGVNVATAVDGIRITYTDNGNDVSTPCDGMVVQEIDVIGQPTAVPEPGSILLLASGVFGLAVCVYRKRK